MEGRLYLLLRRLSALVREDLRAVADARGTTVAQVEALHFLAAANRFSDTLTGLAAFFGTRKGTVSELVGELEAAGLVRREQDPGDRRVQHLVPTDRGLGLARDAAAEALRGAPGAAADAVEALLHAVVAARGAGGFGICATCAHHQRGPGGLRCGLLGVALSEADAARWCVEHAA